VNLTVVKMLVVIPLQKEVDFFLRALSKRGHLGSASKIGVLPADRFESLGTVVACGGLGKAQFALQTQHLIDGMTGLDLAVCAGAAGALAENLAPGDVVVAAETVEHDIRNLLGKPLMPRFSASENAVLRMKSFIPRGPYCVHFGPVAGGDEDIADAARKAEIRLKTGAIAAAWEGPGAARACRFSGVPFVEIRGITDSADKNAASHFWANLESAIEHVAEAVLWLAEDRREAHGNSQPRRESV
jgi:adenosylhomocysteine nucleosidase